MKPLHLETFRKALHLLSALALLVMLIAALGSPSLKLLMEPLNSAMVGTLLMSVNLDLLARGLYKLFATPGEGASKGVIAILLALKTLFLGLAVFLLLHYLAARPLALVVGMGLPLLLPLPVLLLVNLKRKGN